MLVQSEYVINEKWGVRAAVGTGQQRPGESIKTRVGRLDSNLATSACRSFPSSSNPLDDFTTVFKSLASVSCPLFLIHTSFHDKTSDCGCLRPRLSRFRKFFDCTRLLF